MTRFTPLDGCLQYYYISSTLGVLHLERIDHGVKLAEDPEFMKRVAAQGILSTVCLLSNVVLRCVDKAERLPIRKFLDLLDPIPH